MIIKTKIESLNHQGEGIGKLKGKVVFVSDALIGEEVDVKIIDERKKYATGKVINYNSFSNDRIKVECPYYNECGGCNISHTNYDSQIDFKVDKLKNILSKYSDIDINPNVIASSNEFYYRNKISLKIKDNMWGYYKPRSHDIIKIDKCLITSKVINKVIENKELFKITNGETVIRSNYKEEVLIELKTLEEINIDVDKLLKEVNIAGIIVNDKVIYGKDYFYEQINDYKFKVNYKSFYQVNNNILEKINNIINKKEYKTVVDLYCGVGVLGTFTNNDKLYGIEISDSINDAKESAKLNKINDSTYIHGDSFKIKDIEDKIDLIIIDPPRKGIDKTTTDNILDKKPNNIIYMSCNPISLARDLNIFKDEYQIVESYMLDMFPQTHHVESIIIMQKKDK